MKSGKHHVATRDARLSAAMRVAVVLMMSCPLVTAHGRELSTDRPDATESPFTLDSGRLQLEASAASYLRDRHTPERDGAEVEIWNLAPINLRLGLTPRWELQVVVDGHLDVKLENRELGVRLRRRGWGDLTLRAKHNLWGNDGGRTAFAVMPYIKLPTASNDLGNDSVEGGALLPFGMDLNADVSLGAMTGVGVVRNAADDGYEAIWINTIALGRGLTERLGGFIELTLEVGAGKPAVGFNTGLTYTLGHNAQLDAGLNLGITRAAPDLGVFAGVSRRF